MTAATTRPASLDPPTWERRSVQAGEWKITALCDGFLRLDGGAMWGVVPQNIWRQLTPPLEDNTILLAMRPFLVERGDLKLVIELGAGDRWSDKLRQIYHLIPTTNLDETLRACAVSPEEVTHVIASHCHWDHIGAQVIERAGELVPRFANAQHFAPAVEVLMAKEPGHARRGSYRAEDVTPIEEAGLQQTWTGSREIVSGVRVHELGGHSDGVSVITINEDGPGETAIFWADVVPTTHHIQPAYIMAYDIDVVRSFEVRSEWMQRAADEGWIGLFYHDVDHAFGRLSKPGRRFELQPIDGAAW
ncbi:MAG: MBL fold metallo-hydrolase [bacterium]|nr:MBL fold metallo-hydrolase [Planctomycetota bacterium]